MLSCSTCTGKLPREYRKAAEALFQADSYGKSGEPSSGGLNGKSSLQAETAVLTFADSLGVGEDYRKLDARFGELEQFLHSFRNNLELLIQKTWVEKGDEDRKEKLLDRVPGFITLIKNEDYGQALGEFGLILEELAWLLFGSQSRKEDFFEYAFRIDHQLGLFWWYGGQLERFLTSGRKDGEILKAVLLLGLCYLTDF
ncbi:hypothetical protein AGMMS50230_05670 [Spirochaetia bacterium]|nr:hypothetical protein AGMMS50230_05670 [Spirochaetia bacterium]